MALVTISAVVLVITTLIVSPLPIMPFAVTPFMLAALPPLMAILPVGAYIDWLRRIVSRPIDDRRRVIDRCRIIRRWHVGVDADTDLR
jgi:hypothetical protein